MEKTLREKVQESRKIRTIKETAAFLNISPYVAAYYSEDKEAYRKRKAEQRKRFLIELKKEHGGKCCKCGYDKNMSALCFHHTSNDKEHEISDLARNSRFSLARKEAKKCILVCANCHAEIHNPEK